MHGFFNFRLRCPFSSFTSNGGITTHDREGDVHPSPRSHGSHLIESIIEKPKGQEGILQRSLRSQQIVVASNTERL